MIEHDDRSCSTRGILGDRRASSQAGMEALGWAGQAPWVGQLRAAVGDQRAAVRGLWAKLRSTLMTRPAKQACENRVRDLPHVQPSPCRQEDHAWVPPLGERRPTEGSREEI